MIVTANGRVKEITDQSKIEHLLKKGWVEMPDGDLEAYKLNNCLGDKAFLCVPEMQDDDEIYGYQITYKTIKRGLDKHNVYLAETTKAHVNHFHITPPFNADTVTRRVNKGVKRAILTMWETEELYKHWAQPLNEKYDVMFVPASYLIDSFRAIGVTIPIELLPLGIQEAYFDYKPRKKPKKKFRFIHWNSGEPRKGYYELIEAWGKYFADRDDVELVLKHSTRTDPRHINMAFEHAGYEPNQFKNIIKISEPYTTEQMLELLHSSHALIYPSSGEGYGYTPREAMATGLPVIMTDEHAFKDIPSDLYTHVKSSKARAKKQYKDFEWFKPDVDDIAKQMNNMIDNYDTALKTAKKAYEYVDKHEHIQDIIDNTLIPQLKKHELI